MTTFDQVLDLIASEYRVPRSQLLLPTRGTKEVAWARQIAMYLTRQATGDSWSALGRMFHRDRTTVRYACRVVEDLTNLQPGFLDYTEGLIRRVRPAPTL